MAAVSVLLFAGLAAPAQATFSGSNGQLAIVFGHTDRTGFTGGLDLRGPGGKITTVLTCNQGDNSPTGVDEDCPHNPSFSPDGSRLALGFGKRLVVANGDGSERSILPPLTAWDREPAWAPDGERLVFTGGPAGRPDLWIVKADGTGLRRLTTEGGHSPSWSAKNRIAYARGRRIRTIRPSGKGDEFLVRGANPDWSPTGAGIVFDRAGNVYTHMLRQADATRARLVMKRAWSAVFSPDGKKIAFLRPPGDAESSVYTAAIRAKRVKRVYRPRRADGAFNFAAEPAWRPVPLR